MWYTMITFQFLFADFFSSVKLKIVFLCNFSGSSSKPLPELKTSFKYSQMYKVSYTLLVLPEKISPLYSRALLQPGLCAPPAVISSQPRTSLHHHLGIPFPPGALLTYRASLFLVMSSFCQVTDSF